MKNKKRHIESLNEIEKTEGFKTPDGYFDQLQMDVLNKIDTDTTEKSRGKTILFRNFYAVAASIALLAVSVITIWYFNNQSRSTREGYTEILAEVSDDEIIAYLEYSDVSYYEIGSFVYDESGAEMKEDPTEYFEFEEDEADALLEYYSL
ncbi:hypothetical protein [uncultured Marivirga sp.]|uniref:hypothetical protein n=1 Tax=uncultured Marivirga sp. TaxID=1123707 RepID=UPI0030ED0597|tara:strand:+ start:511545 stop:511994 length:450 start_codon:yes stop_codon:yes gene_type:complete